MAQDYSGGRKSDKRLLSSLKAWQHFSSEVMRYYPGEMNANSHF